jgi:hypothetical protein
LAGLGSRSIPLFWRKVEERHPFEQAITVERSRVLIRHDDFVALVLDAGEWLVEASNQALITQFAGPFTDGVFGEAEALAPSVPVVPSVKAHFARSFRVRMSASTPAECTS